MSSKSTSAATVVAELAFVGRAIGAQTLAEGRASDDGKTTTVSEMSSLKSLPKPISQSAVTIDGLRPLSMVDSVMPESAVAGARKALALSETAGSSAATGVTLSSLGSPWTKRGEIMKSLLTDRGLNPNAVLEPFGMDVDANAEAMERAFAGPELFHLERCEVVSPDTVVGFADLSCIPVHIYGLDMMVVGETTKDDFHRVLAEKWKGVVKHVAAITGQFPVFKNKVLEAILKHHVKGCSPMYCIFVHCSDSTKMCTTRAGLILDWVQSLKHDADTYWARQKDVLAVKALRGTIKRFRQIKTYTSDSVPSETLTEFSAE
jgi:hypothetical protein